MLLECPTTMAISLSHQRPWERVAQPVEHVTFNHGVLGSSPSALTKGRIDCLADKTNRTEKLCVGPVLANRLRVNMKNIPAEFKDIPATVARYLDAWAQSSRRHADGRAVKIMFGKMREMGLQGVVVYRHCGHHVALSADRWPDDVRLSDIEPRFVYAGCGNR